MRKHAHSCLCAASLSLLFAAACGTPYDRNDVPKHGSPVTKARTRQTIGEQQLQHPSDWPAFSPDTPDAPQPGDSFTTVTPAPQSQTPHPTTAPQ